jgi:two-component system, OmpR family, alkaline phosphatase synthesis response regulator PhoP
MGEARILVVDDEKNITDLLSAYLRKENYDVIEASDGISALKAARAFKPDLIILDIMLPHVDGLEVLAQLRRESNVYVIMLTARTEETDKVIGLSVGADDYVTKPFSPREIVARVKAALRRLRQDGQGTKSDMLIFKELRIDSAGRKVWLKEALVDLTAMEFNLLTTLAEHSGMVMSREQLLEKVWGYDYYGEMRVVDVHIGHIRQKLDGKYIKTVRGVGYRFEDELIHAN